jgi:hypothetical protein
VHTATVAVTSGPKAPAGTPGGRGAGVATPHCRQVSVCHWYSVIVGRTTGSSVTCWRRGAGSVPRRTAPHPRQCVGRIGLT